MRLDRALKEWGLVPSRAKAQELLAAGDVEALRGGEWQVETNAHREVDFDNDRQNYRLRTTEKIRFVSRGGLKLQGALDYLAAHHAAIKIQGAHALDIGLSTGGFTDCLLQNGAVHVVGVDVGHGQLAAPLKTHPRLTHFEGVNARALSQAAPMASYLPSGFDLIVIDVSFISLTQIIPEAVKFLRPRGHLIALIKPQFEVGPDLVGKSGVVVDPGAHEFARARARLAFIDARLEILAEFPSPIPGGDGNSEFFICGRHAG